jgi:hypothetical protein
LYLVSSALQTYSSGLVLRVQSLERAFDRVSIHVQRLDQILDLDRLIRDK